jgi:hypothetical protein
MKTNNKTCDCELCLFKTFPYNNPLANDKKKIIEAIVYHYIVRLSSLVKSRKDLNSYIIKFIMTINQSYLEKPSDLNELKTSINVMYKNLTDLGKCCRFSSNSSLTKLTHKEATYLKLIISALDEGEGEEENDKKEEVISPIKIIVDLVEDAPIETVTAVTAVTSVTAVTAVTAVTSISEDGVLVDLPIQQDVSGSYLSYCSIS